MMKIMTIVGTRPELIRLSRIIPLLDTYTDHVFVHTGQNYDPNLNDIFFKELGIRYPDISLDRAAIPKILEIVDEVLDEERPDKILILGDTNSGLSALMAKRKGIPVYHMEAGNRCFDDRVPEEVNRRVIDQCSDVLMPYTEGSKQNLLAEGFRSNRIFVIGNPIHEVIRYYVPVGMMPKLIIDKEVIPGQYFLVTLHRAETLHDKNVLCNVLESLYRVQLKYEMPIVISVHPHLKDVLRKYGLQISSFMQHEPFGFGEFVSLERHAACVLTDSGTVQEECSILNVPCVILRDVTERPETVEAGGGIIAGRNNNIVNAVRVAMELQRSTLPSDYSRLNVSDVVMKILMSEVPP